MKEILSKKPFNLNEEQQEWVMKTFNSLTEEEKIGQLFLMIGGMNPNMNLKETLEKFKPGGFMYRTLPKKEIFNEHKIIQKYSKVPCFIAANTEAGGDGICNEGTHVGANMQVAATNNPKMALKQGEISARELRALGGNLSFAPVVDINFEFKNPIANLRAYSDEVEKVLEMSVQNVIGTQSEGAAASVKHFPGDGVDSRDQHLMPTMNHLSLKEWKKSFGKVYQAVFDAGALTTMVGHFLLPNLISDLTHDGHEDMWIPSSFNKTILNKLLREELGFNGLILTDATIMAGMTSTISRRKMVPLSIENGADVFLFVRNADEDYESMREGLKNGVLSQKRLDEAVMRILATKAALNLHIDLHLSEDNLSIIGREDHIELSKKISKDSITLVKNEDKLFPLDEKIKSILLIDFIKKNPDNEHNVLKTIVNNFNKNGVSVDVRQYDIEPMQAIIDSSTSIKDFMSKYDAIFYFSDRQPSSNSSQLLIEWKAIVGMDAPGLLVDIPTAWVSLGSPYHLYDAPMIRNFINAYGNKESNINILFDKIFGKDSFVGVSPVDTDVRYPNYKK